MELKNIKQNIMNKLPKPSTMSIQNTFSYAWQPHNYRRYIPYNRKLLNTILLNKVVLKKLASYTEHTKKYFYKNFIYKKDYRITIEIGSESITAIYSSKKWHRLKADNLNEISNLIEKQIVTMEDICAEAIKKFIKKYNGKAYFKEARWSRQEDGLEGDEFLDNLPKNMIIHSETFKKVYEEKVEFKSPVLMENYIHNRALQKVAPIIAQKLDDLVELKELTRLEIYNKKLHLKVLRGIDKSNKMLVISNEKLVETMEHIKDNILRVKYEGRRLSGLERALIKT